MSIRSSILKKISEKGKLTVIELFNGVQPTLWVDFFSTIESLLEDEFISEDDNLVSLTDKGSINIKINTVIDSGIAFPIPTSYLDFFTRMAEAFFAVEGYLTERGPTPGLKLRKEDEDLCIIFFDDRGLSFKFAKPELALTIILLTLSFLRYAEKELAESINNGTLILHQPHSNEEH